MIDLERVSDALETACILVCVGLSVLYLSIILCCFTDTDPDDVVKGVWRWLRNAEREEA